MVRMVRCDDSLKGRAPFLVNEAGRGYPQASNVAWDLRCPEPRVAQNQSTGATLSRAQIMQTLLEGGS
jgi:hypothetical protein